MSDYLWDKTGEPEEDVAQLENLLGALKYKECPLEIPATAMPSAERPAATTIFSRPRLAIAASLILMLLAGAWLMTRQSERQANQLATTDRGSATVGDSPTETADVAMNKTGNSASGDNAVESKSQGAGVSIVKASAPKSHRRSRQLVATRQKLPPRRDENSPAPRHEEVAGIGAPGLQFDQTLTPQQREATEQLMFALRLASAKLNYAQREMQEIGRAGK